MNGRGFLGTRKQPSGVRKAIIFTVAFVGAILFFSFTSGSASAAPVSQPVAQAPSVKQVPVLASPEKGGARTIQRDRTAEKYAMTIAIGCAGGFAAGGPGGAYFGCSGAVLGVLVDWGYSD